MASDFAPSATREHGTPCSVAGVGHHRHMADIQPRFPGPSSVVGAASRFVAWEIRVARYMVETGSPSAVFCWRGSTTGQQAVVSLPSAPFQAPVKPHTSYITESGTI